jgi:hypothetical protein
MTNMKNLKSAFKPAPERFHYSVQSAIDEAKLTEKKRFHLKHPAQAIVAAIIIIALIPSSVFAVNKLLPMFASKKGEYGLELKMNSKSSSKSPKYVKLNVKNPKGFKKSKNSANIKYEKDIDSSDKYLSFLLIRPEKNSKTELLKNVKEYKETTINGNQAYIIKDKGGYTSRIETFFENVNILLTCYIGTDIKVKEALTFIKGVNITEGTKNNHTEYVSPDEGTKAEIQYFPKEYKYLPLPIGKEITYGDDLDLSISYRIDSIKILDKPFDKDKNKYYFEGDDFDNHIDSNFNLIPQKNEKWEYGDGVNTEDKLISSKTEKMKFVVAKVTYTNHSNEPTFGLNFGIEYLDKNKNGDIDNPDSTITVIQYNKDIKSSSDIYIGNLKKGESHTYTIGFTVYESQLNKACLTISNEPDNADFDKYGNDYDLTYFTRVQ